jgi:hypothetical protein
MERRWFEKVWRDAARAGRSHPRQRNVHPSSLLAALTLHAQNRADNCAQFYNPQREAALGARLAKSFGIMPAQRESDAVRSYIEKLGSRLAVALPYEPRLGYRFEVTADANGTFLETAALPGGYISFRRVDPGRIRGNVGPRDRAHR